jgi:hypothetical protein
MKVLHERSMIDLYWLKRNWAFARTGDGQPGGTNTSSVGESLTLFVWQTVQGIPPLSLTGKQVKSEKTPRS